MGRDRPLIPENPPRHEFEIEGPHPEAVFFAMGVSSRDSAISTKCTYDMLWGDP